MTQTALSRNRYFIAAALLLAMTFCHLMLVLSLLPSLRNGYQDFTIFYSAGTMIRTGQAGTLYDLSAQYAVQRQFAPHVTVRQAALPYNHPPFEALLFLPFTFFAYWPAYMLWTVLNFIMIGVTLALLRQFPGISSLPPAFLCLGATAFFPLAIGIVQGQDSILLLLICVLGMTAWEREQDALAGAVLAAGLFKFHLMIPIVLLLAMRRWRVLLGFLPVAAGLAAVSVAIMGWSGPLHYVRFVLHLEKTGAGGAIGANGMPTLHGLFANLPGLSASPLLVTLLTLLSSIAVFAIAALRIKRGPDATFFTFSLCSVTAILVSYHALAYDLSLLLPVALLLLSDAVSGQSEAMQDRTILILLFLTPLYVVLWFVLNKFFFFALVPLWLFVRLVGSRPKAE